MVFTTVHVSLFELYVVSVLVIFVKNFMNVHNMLLIVVSASYLL